MNDAPAVSLTSNEIAVLATVGLGHLRTLPQVLTALDELEVEVTQADTYAEIRLGLDIAGALKLMFRQVDTVKIRAEDVILKAHVRIGEELQKVPKANARRIIEPGKSSEAGRAAVIPSGTARARHMKLADHKDEVPAVAKKLREQGKDATPTAVVRELTQGDKKVRRATRERDLGAAQRALPQTRYGVIYADPPWSFEPYSTDTGMDRAADNHYPTMSLDAIAALAVPAADDCVLFLWATVPMLPEALKVMAAWGFTYKSHFVWVKDKAGTGYWNRNRHELLLIGTRGSVPAPAPGEQYSSVIDAVRAVHSAKPFAFHEIIEAMFPTLPRLEMFARGDAFAGWDRWGNEA